MSSIGIRGAYFTPFLLTIETFEIALQTWQAYRTSKYISNPHINVLYGIAIFINCWSTAVIHHVWEHKYKHPLMARFLSALVDAILDFTWGVVFQGVLVWRYWSLERTMSALLVLLEVPENSDRELRQILVVSFSNFVLSGFPFLQTSIVLHELAFLLDDARISTINSRKSATEQSTLRGPAVPFRAILVETRLKRAFRRTIPHEIWRLSTIMLRIYHVCTMVYGAIILSISIAATGSNSVDGTGVTCQYRLYPWLTNSIYCVGRTIDCSKMGLMGSRNDLSNVLSSVNPYLLGNLVFANCEQLEIPSKVRDFTGLGTISIRNSTLTAWDDDAAVNQIFEELQTLQLVQVQVNCVPSGIMNQPFPESLEWVRFESITGEPFVPKVSDAWHSAVFFTCNDCQLLSIPAAVNSMTRVALYELKDNSLTTISGDCFVNKPSLTEIQLAGNPIEDLPIEAWALLNQLSWLDIRSTNISAIPTVDLSTANIVIYAYGSPLCAGSNSHTLPSQIVCDENSTVA
ncbi:TPA: hypothetical protein N0F65_011164 [Lagenidium giganteum]|uniref:Uncharacterized protein n=1 Tax=Lagenidium giganteum TaxID=4803 RepID=A0AAV2Z9J8_9STRA|nr:TPA: hypothetical protein N0F65_011164 [Lagenidium giganteum]